MLGCLLSGMTHRDQYIWDFMLSGGKSTMPKHNALFLWDNPNTDTINLYLACSKHCGKTNVEAYFIYQIPHPILTIKPPVNTQEIIDDIILPKLDFGQMPTPELNLDDTDDINEETNSDETKGDNEGESDENDTWGTN
jgi:hypothetical protein